jgi:FAD/FMN-containing dehydrogenase
MNAIIDSIIQKIPSLKILRGEQLNDEYIHVWRMDEKINCLAILFPKNTNEISEILALCHEYHQPVVVHGGLTNLVSSTATQKNEIVISMKHLNKIIEVDVDSRTMTVEAGVILEEVLIKADSAGLFFPVNYGAKGTAQIGGAVSTNAGGTRVLRYGMVRDQVLGMEAVLADGTIVSSLKKIIKDNSGFDWKHLMIGTEGIYGIVTRVVLRLREKPKSRASVMMGVRNYPDVVRLLKFMDQGMGGLLSGFELMWGDTYKSLTSFPSVYKPPLPYEYPLYVLAEILGGNQQKDLSLLEEVVEQSLKNNIIEDAVFASSISDLKWFWGIREDVNPLLSYGPYHQTFDISIPIPGIGAVVNETKQSVLKCEGVQACFALGHIGDGNIHFIILKNNNSLELNDKINNIVYKRISELKGSVSAEHGIGIDKLEFLPLSRSKEEILLMRQIKTALDPINILNRGKVIP